jgi:tyrosine-protein kinase Etk/Wzc
MHGSVSEMRPPRSVIGSLAHIRIFGSPWPLRGIFALLIAVMAIFSLYPEKYRAAVSLTPADPSSLGLSGALTQLGAMNSVFGNQSNVEIALKVGRSVFVRESVAKELHLMQRMKFANRLEMHRWLESQVAVRSLRGGILLIETFNQDPKLAQDLVRAYSDATRLRLAEISRRQTEYKRDVLLELVNQASDRLGRAQDAYDRFRLQTRYGDPEAAMEAIAARIPVLEQAIKAKEVQLNAARQFYTEDNMTVRQLVAERDALVRQLAQAKATNPSQSNSVGRVVRASTQADKLLRELTVAKMLYDGYLRFLQGTSVEDLTSMASVRVLEPPFIDTDRQINYRFAAIGFSLFLLWIAIEFYRVRPAVGDRVVVREKYAQTS